MEPALRITTLQAQAITKDAPGLRLNIERLLSTADLRPPGLPPQTVLVVRRFGDPQPGRLAAGLGAARVHAAWERAARQQLAELQRRAARPALGSAPPDATAVLFADEAELLACLARDIGHDLAGQRWWWRALLRTAWGGSALGGNDEYANALVKQLVRQAHLAPAVLARLHEWGEAAAALRTLTPGQAAAVLQAALLARGLPGLPADRSGFVRAQPPPWLADERAPAALAASLGRERDALLGVGVDLVARPQVVASAAYQRRFHAWWQAAGGSKLAQPDSNTPEPVRESAGDPEQVRESAAGVRDLARHFPPAQGRAASGPLAPPQVDALPPGSLAGDAGLGVSNLAGVVQPARRIAGDSPDAPGLSGSRRAAEPIGVTAGDAPLVARAAQPGPFAGAAAAGSTDLVAPVQPTRASQAATAQIASLQESPMAVRTLEDAAGDSSAVSRGRQPAISAAVSSVLLVDGVPTRLGGVLYLINLMVALDLPDCCETGWRLASGVGPWGLLHALGQELLASNGPAPDDPLWPALAHLDGRSPDQPPGVRLPRSRPRRWPPFELPASWFKDWDFDTAQTPTQPAASAPHPRWRSAGLCNRYPPLLARWLALALPFIDLRLRLALSLPPEASLAAGLLALPGQLYVTATHVDLVASLQHISLPARLAGLDRNPGWLPDFGRVVTYHFT